MNRITKRNYPNCPRKLFSTLPGVSGDENFNVLSRILNSCLWSIVITSLYENKINYLKS